MEKEENGSTIATAIATVADSQRPPTPAKKRSGSTNMLRAVMLAFNGRSSKKSHVSNIIVGTNTADTVIKTLVGGMRPLHYSLDYQHPAPPPPPPDMVIDAYYDVHMPPSPCSSVGMSRFASAEDLQLLDDTSEDNEEDGINGEPNAIDMKAEEFITMFYKQMRQQRRESLNSTAEEKSTTEESASPPIEEEEAKVLESEDPIKATEKENATAEESARPLNEEEEAKDVEIEDPIRTTEKETATAEENANPLEPIEGEKATVEA